MSLSTVGFKFSTVTLSTGEYTVTVCWHNVLSLPVSFKHFPLLHYKLQAAEIKFFFNEILVVLSHSWHDLLTHIQINVGKIIVQSKNMCSHLCI